MYYMGLEGDDDYEWKMNPSRMNVKAAKACTVCLVWLVTSVAGGAVLALWGLKDRPTNHNLWMVPLGLILLATPQVICLSLVLSAPCSCPHPTPNKTVSVPETDHPPICQNPKDIEAP